MGNTVISADKVSKRYILNHLASSGKEDMAINAIKKWGKSLFNSKPQLEEFWALKDVSFSIQKGDRVGIVGRNGAGKSTLLKILSRIVAPTNGRIEIEGRLASLLEVGTGFHGDLTGRENIYLNGSILGMKKKEIDARFDEIVAFSEIERFLDTPVKRYSSGMYVRLAFAVAAHLESEILVVDEVLAVGDAAFQRKCLGKMSEISEGEGRTILFVSHSMHVVQKLCNVGLFLQKGELIKEGAIQEIVNLYLDSGIGTQSKFEFAAPKELSYGRIESLTILSKSGKEISEVPVGEAWKVAIQFELIKPTEHFIIGFGVVSSHDIPIRTSWSKPEDMQPGKYEAVFDCSDVMLTTGTYKIAVGLSSNKRAFHYSNGDSFVSVSDAGSINESDRIVNTESGLILNPMSVTINNL
ncbi:MAG: ABC transporter ATP-binding protein [Bacteroidia bacterium]